MSNFADALAAPVTSLAFCWRIVRRDGAALGLTSHDASFELDGLLYRAAPGMAPSAVVATDKLEVDAMEVAGLLSSDSIRQADLESGRFDGARVDFFLVDWDRPDLGTRTLVSGFIGTISREDKLFRAELRSSSSLLQASPLELYSPECRAMLGDRRCRVDLARYRHLSRMVRVVAPREFECGLSQPDDYFAYGHVEVLHGENAGFFLPVESSRTGSIRLAEVPPFPLQAGAAFYAQAGCDKRFDTCVSKFNNVVNFRGEPHVPGNDLVTRYAGL